MADTQNKPVTQADFTLFKGEINADLKLFKTEINADLKLFKTEMNSNFVKFKTETNALIKETMQNQLSTIGYWVTGAVALFCIIFSYVYNQRIEVMQSYLEARTANLESVVYGAPADSQLDKQDNTIIKPHQKIETHKRKPHKRKLKGVSYNTL